MNKAVVACDGAGNGVLLYCSGMQIEIEVSENGRELNRLCLDDADEGITVWEGTYVYTQDHDGDWDIDVSSDSRFREPTPEEWASIVRGENPWPCVTRETVTYMTTGEVTDMNEPLPGEG